jgi:hypothetical protein
LLVLDVSVGRPIALTREQTPRDGIGPLRRHAAKVINVAVLIGAGRAQADPLSEAYFVSAAGALDTHCAGPRHACVSCAATWPCDPALAAAFMLELHTD